jgi:ribosomal-protein-alanine N-acetyltransferase
VANFGGWYEPPLGRRLVTATLRTTPVIAYSSCLDTADWFDWGEPNASKHGGRRHEADAHGTGRPAMEGVFMSTGYTDKQDLRVHIRWMIRRDMPEVLQIEEDSYDYPWSEEDFLRCLRQRNCIGMVAELGEKVVGFMIYELHKNKLHILNFAVHPSYRRQHIGAQMIQKLVSKLSSHRRTSITLEVRETNLTAQVFFRDAGFRAVRVVREYFEDTGEDAYLLQYRYTTPVGVEDPADSVAQYEA